LKEILISILESAQESKKLFDYAIENGSISLGLSITLSSVENWKILITKFISLLGNSEDIAFGEKFMELCSVQESMAKLLFTYMDVELYEVLSDAMVNSSDAFLEAGNAWDSFKDYDPFSLKRSAGMGLRVFLPMFGTIGFDYGVGFDKRKKGEKFFQNYGEFNIIIGVEPE